MQRAVTRAVNREFTRAERGPQTKLAAEIDAAIKERFKGKTLRDMVEGHAS